jgi:hypothetical protein
VINITSEEYSKEVMKKEIVKCVCGKWTKPKMFKIDGFDVRGSECPKCNEGYLNGEDANLVYKFNQLKKQKLKATITTTGSSYAIRIPKALVELFKLKKGKKINISLKDLHTIQMDL